MKKKLFQAVIGFVIQLTFTTSSNAQWTHSGTVTYLNNLNDFVGIGTTAPSYKVDVKQDGNCNLRIQSKVNGSSNMILSRASGPSLNCLVNYKTGTTALWYTGCTGTDDFRIKDAGNNDALTILQSNRYIGIGNYNPAYLLDIAGTIRLRNDGSSCGIWYNNAANTSTTCLIGMITDNTYGIYSPSIGNWLYSYKLNQSHFGIGTTTPGYSLTVISADNIAGYISTPFVGGTALKVYATATSGNSWALYGSAPTSGYAGYFSGNVYCTGSYLPSDERLKENIQPLQNALEKIMKLDVKTYNFKHGFDQLNLPRVKQNGFLAQNIESLFPELVVLNSDKSSDEEHPVEFKTVNYIGMIPVLTAALQEEQKQNEEKDSRIISLEKQNVTQQMQIDALILQMKKFESALAGCCPGFRSIDDGFLNDKSQNAFPALEQNQPNPFSGKTVIKYYLPSGSGQAMINILAANGQVVHSFVIKEKGEGQVEIDAGLLPAGNYTYCLVIDGRTTESRQMVITK